MTCLPRRNHLFLQQDIVQPLKGDQSSAIIPEFADMVIDLQNSLRTHPAKLYLCDQRAGDGLDEDMRNSFRVGPRRVVRVVVGP